MTAKTLIKPLPMILSRRELFCRAAEFKGLKVDPFFLTAIAGDWFQSVIGTAQLERKHTELLKLKGSPLPVQWFAPWANEETQKMFPGGYTQDGWSAVEPVVTMPIDLRFAFTVPRVIDSVEMVLYAQGIQFGVVSHNRDIIVTVASLLAVCPPVLIEALEKPLESIFVSLDEMGIGELRSVQSLLEECFSSEAINLMYVNKIRFASLPDQVVQSAENMERLYVPKEHWYTVTNQLRTELDAFKAKVAVL